MIDKDTEQEIANDKIADAAHDSNERLWDDSNEALFTKATLGKVNFCSGWDMANIFRYATACNELYGLRYPEIERAVNVLDLGCSLATFYTFWMSSFSSPGRPRVNYIGLEVRPEIVKKANALYSEANSDKKQVHVYLFDAMKERLNKFHNVQYEMILLQEVLEHIGIPSVKIILKDASQMIVDDGVIVISTPNPKKHEGQQFTWPENHLYEFTLPEMLAEVDEAGLRPYQITGWLGKAVPMKHKFSKEQRAMYDRMKTISTGFATAVLANMYPELAMCYTIMCCKKENTNKPVISDEELSSYMPYLNTASPRAKSALLEL
jgi:2-polyprenyl-3-methyl-5-hydroxy-6-metoxy-1,4-benzoquinol methylase